jgi:hypothetical protein
MWQLGPAQGLHVSGHYARGELLDSPAVSALHFSDPPIETSLMLLLAGAPATKDLVLHAPHLRQNYVHLLQIHGAPRGRQVIPHGWEHALVHVQKEIDGTIANI